LQSFLCQAGTALSASLERFCLPAWNGFACLTCGVSSALLAELYLPYWQGFICQAGVAFLAGFAGF